MYIYMITLHYTCTYTCYMFTLALTMGLPMLGFVVISALNDQARVRRFQKLFWAGVTLLG